MTRYTVCFTKIESISVEVEADNPADALVAAYEDAPADVCALCSGWGQTWTRESGDELTTEEVYDKAIGDVVWSAPDEWTRHPR